MPRSKVASPNPPIRSLAKNDSTTKLPAMISNDIPTPVRKGLLLIRQAITATTTDAIVTTKASTDKYVAIFESPIIYFTF
ncbi:MAG: hypothetical protein GWN94_16595 [Phycisphaerae bacterium]|nr:hypothetical protein [Phycisphaerae bacterium]